MIERLAAHPFATIFTLMAITMLMKGAGLSLGPPRPVAKRFLTRREEAMLAKLKQVLPHCRIHAQVAMGALLAVPDSAFRRRRLSDRNAFSQKIVDVVAQDRASGAVVALIEVDDWSHVLSRDAAPDAMTERAGYRAIRICAPARKSLVTRVAMARASSSPTRCTIWRSSKPSRRARPNGGATRLEPARSVPASAPFAGGPHGQQRQTRVHPGVAAA